MPEGATERASPALSAPGLLLPLESAPPLAGLAALSAFAAMLLNQVLLPGLGSEHNTMMLSRLARAGQFAANLAVISSLITLAFCAVSVARGQPGLTTFRRVLWVLLSLVLLRAAVIATFFERVETTRGDVYL